MTGLWLARTAIRTPRRQTEPTITRKDKPVELEAGTGGVTPSLEALLRAAAADGANVARDVDRWDPPYCGDIGLRIARDGSWHYRGSPITRMGLIKLFASILRKDQDGRTYAVTPAEKVDVAVDDAPFMAVELAISGQGEQQLLTVRTNVDDVVAIGADHPIRFECQLPDGGLKPYVRVRGQLDALCTRSVYAELVSLAEARASDGALGFWSGGCWWQMTADEPSLG